MISSSFLSRVLFCADDGADRGFFVFHNVLPPSESIPGLSKAPPCCLIQDQILKVAYHPVNECIQGVQTLVRSGHWNTKGGWGYEDT